MTDKLDLQTADGVSLNVERIAALFPHCVTETAEGKAIDFDLLRQELSADIVEGPKERYRLEWPGKREAIVTANMPTTNTLRPVREDSVNFDTTENLYIEGDNLEVLKLLQESYLGKVKMIYIDPPYNTGNDFVYRDNFAQDSDEYKADSGMTDELGNRLVANPETAGRYHSDWLTMMYPRLKLARNLLTEDGVIFISIDDNEVHNLRKMCDEVFGEVNVIINFIWELPRGINAGYISKAHEYVLVYAKNISTLKLFHKDYPEVSIERCNKKIDARHPESSIQFPAGVEYEGEDKVIEGVIQGSESIRIEGKMIFQNGRLSEPVTLYAGWTMKDMIQNWLRGEEITDLKGQKIKRFFFKENGRLYSEKTIEFDSPKSILRGFGDSQSARKEMFELFKSEDFFDYPKPLSLLKKFVTFQTKKNDIILDFFSGSCSTAHAVMQLNSEDGGNRKFIMVQLPEKTDEKSEAYKAGYKNICEIGKERIRRAGKKLTTPSGSPEGGEKESAPNLFENAESVQLLPSGEVGRGLDIGFRVFRLDTSNMQDVYYRPQDYTQEMMNELFANHIKPDRTPDDLVAQVMLDWGLPLSLPIEQVSIAGKTVYKVAGNALYCCFDEGIDEEFVRALTSPPGSRPHPSPLLEEREQERGAASALPLRIVFHDYAFANDTAKENVRQLLKQLSAETEMRVV
jgi:adenine-specific DNA-methyltransferase